MVLNGREMKRMDNRSKLGSRLRAVRKERSLTQRELASRAGVSSNAISLIERGEISPSVSTLQNLATALQVQMSYFFDEDVQTDILHMKASERPALESKEVMIEGLGKRLNGQEIEPFFVSLAPNSEGDGRQVIHPGHEFVYCVRGRVTYEIDGDVYVLSEGDSLLFEAQLPHHWRNLTSESAELLLILQTADGSNEAVRRHFPSYPSLTHVG